jgi:LmbE family N-acetylglucosaminyl deacetylase
MERCHSATAVGHHGGMEILVSPERALVVTAHPDDVDFGAGGTVATLVASGCAVSYCIITDGDAGGFDPDEPRENIPGIRRSEQRSAAAALGVSDVRFLGYRDGQLTVTHELRRDIARVIRQVRPNLVITQSPDRNYRRIYSSHPDHMAAGEAALQAVYPDARNPFAHPALLADEGLAEWSVPQVWVMGREESDHVVDITDVFEKKLAALRSHVSQVSHLSDLAGQVRKWGESIARDGGLPAGRVGEMFTVVDTR